MSYEYPDERGHFGEYGGRYVAETLMPALLELEQAYAEAKADPDFQQQFEYYLKNYVGRPSPLYFAERLTKELGGAQIYLKREDFSGQRVYIWKGFQEGSVIWKPLIHTRLLQNDFPNPGTIWVVGLSHGQLPLVFFIPPMNYSTKFHYLRPL